jgi:hypothetical protein
MSSKFDPFKNSSPVPENFGQVQSTPSSVNLNLTPVILIGAIVIILAAAASYNYGKKAKLKNTDD